MNANELVEYAAKFGLAAEVGSRSSIGGDMFVVAVERSPEAGTWSMPITEIAMAKTIEVAIDQAKLALDRMRPRLEKQLAKLPEPIEDDRVQLAAGVSSDGTVSMLRVERDGTMRLAVEDIEAITEAVLGLQRVLSRGRVVVVEPVALEGLAERAGLSITWGDPDEHGVYTPTFTEHDVPTGGTNGP